MARLGFMSEEDKKHLSEMQEKWGCRECRFADHAAIGKGPCCQHLNMQIDDDTDTCLSKKQEEEITTS